MQKCPFCAEEIQDEAIKCRFCASMLEKKPQGKWYFSISVLIITLLSVGPLALPLLWFNPRFSNKTKIIASIAVLIASFYLGMVCAKALKVLHSYYQMAL